jgi:hypothetical protein
VEQVVALVLVAVILVGALSLKLLGQRGRHGLGQDDREALERWLAHLYRGGPED